MAGFILGKKIAQTQMFDDKGVMMPVTKIDTSSCYLVDIKWPTTSGYGAVKLGYGTCVAVNKSIKGQLDKAGIEAPLRFLKEISVNFEAQGISLAEEEGKRGLKIGDEIMYIGQVVKPNVLFHIGETVDVSGISRGKGFQGVVRRYNFRGGPKTHGQSDRHRARGSLAANTTPGRPFKGTRMAGQTGGVRVTIKKLTVVASDETSVTVKGLVPGSKGSLVEVRTYKIA